MSHGRTASAKSACGQFIGQAPDPSLLVGDPGQGADHLRALRGEDFALVYAPTGRPFRLHLAKLSPEGWPPGDKLWWGISRHVRAQPYYLGAAFDSGRADTAQQARKAFPIVNETGLQEKAPINGLAAMEVQAWNVSIASGSSRAALPASMRLGLFDRPPADFADVKTLP